MSPEERHKQLVEKIVTMLRHGSGFVAAVQVAREARQEGLYDAKAFVDHVAETVTCVPSGC